MKLSTFLTNMNDSEKLVAVTEKQLREYAQQCNDWRVTAEWQEDKIKKMQLHIERLEAKLELKEIDKLVTIDLSA